MKKITAWLLILSLMMLLFAGCGSTAASTPEASVSAEAEAPASEPAAVPEEPAPAEPETSVAEAPSVLEEPQEEPEEEPHQFVTVALPITTEGVTFSIWYTWPPVLSNFIEGPGYTEFAVELAARTGVTIDYQLANTEAAQEEFALMAASGTYTDMILGGSSYYNNPDQMIEDGVALDVSEYDLETLMPNYLAVLDSNKDYKLAAYTDAGGIAEFYRFENGTENNVGPVIRKDWLDKLGMEIPSTYDEYYDVLSAFKTEMDCDAPLLMPYTGLTNYYSLGYGVPGDLRNGLFYVVEDEVKYAGMEQEYYDFVTLMTQWYADGLIDQDFLSRTTTTDPDTGLISSGDAGVWTANVLMFDMYGDMVDDPDFAITGTTYPKLSEDSPMMYLSENSVTGTGYTVTTACHDVETCLKWIDYWYSEEGTFFANYGVEGVSFEYDESGNAHLNEAILQSPIGLPSSLTCSIYITSAGPYVNDCYRLQYYFGDLQKTAMESWDNTDETYCSEGYPSAAGLTTEEAETYSAIMSDIETYMEETISSILVGNMDVSALNEMAGNLEAMEIQEAIDLMQAAYDRYLSKAA